MAKKTIKIRNHEKSKFNNLCYGCHIYGGMHTTKAVTYAKNEKTLVVYFSASGVTRHVAQQLAEMAGGDLYEIQPEVAYTDADLNWQDKNARSTIEMHDPSSRPAIKGKVDNMAEYDVVYIGYPIW